MSANLEEVSHISLEPNAAISESFAISGKTLRDGMGQASNRSDAEVLDLIITNALIIDWAGIYKADIGVKNGIIVGIGKGGNPDMMDSVTDGMIVGSSTEVIAGEKMIITAGGIDAHVHYICVDLWREVRIVYVPYTPTSERLTDDMLGPRVWSYDFGWRWHWTLSRNKCNDVHVKQILHEDYDGRYRWNSSQFWIHRKRQRFRRQYAGTERCGRSRSDWPEAS